MTETKRPDGGPAFPLQNADFTEAYGGAPGMTLRDFFAAQAMASILLATAQREVMIDARVIASNAYDYAEAMIAERERGQ